MLGRVWSIHLSDRIFLGSGPSDRVPAIIWLIHSLNIQTKKRGVLFKIKTRSISSKQARTWTWRPGVLQKLAKAPLLRPGTKRENREARRAHAKVTERARRRPRNRPAAKLPMLYARAFDIRYYSPRMATFCCTRCGAHHVRLGHMASGDHGDACRRQMLVQSAWPAGRFRANHPDFLAKSQDGKTTILQGLFWKRKKKAYRSSVRERSL